MTAVRKRERREGKKEGVCEANDTMAEERRAVGERQVTGV